MFNKRTKLGAYTLIMSAVVLAVIILINLLAMGVPSKYTKLDMTELEYYTLDADTVDAVSKVKEEVNIYLLCAGGSDESQGSDNSLPKLSLFLTRYSDINSKIKVTIIDPVANPTFINAYDQSGLSNYNVIVESAKRFKIIDFAELYYYFSEEYGMISADQYQSFMQYAYYYTGSYPSLTLNFDGESKITSALDYVTTDHIPSIYTLEGHGETAISETLKANIKNDSMSVAGLNLMTTQLPEDAECIIINAPTTDINEDEAKILSDYLNNGGKIMLTTLYTNTALPRLMDLLGEYGLSPSEGIVIEGSSGYHYTGYPHYLMPKANEEISLTAPLSSLSMFVPMAHGIISGGETDKNVTATPLFSTSDAAYTIEVTAETIEKTDASTEGKFDIGVLAVDNDTGATIIWLGSPVFDDNMDAMTGANYKYFISMLGGIVERERITYNIPTNAITNYYLVVSEGQALLWGAILVIIIPLIFVVTGVIRWAVRRRK